MMIQSLSAIEVAGTSIWRSLFGFDIPATEKILRTLVVYLGLAIIMRLAGKRQLAQLNSFDLIVMLLVSNVVQNAIIGEDNSVTGGVIGAIGLLAINWLVVRVLFRSKRLTRAFEGRATVLIHNGQIDKKALDREMLTREELFDVIHKQGFEDLHQVRKCELEPNGTFYVEGFNPTLADKQHAELLERLDALSREVAALKA